MQESKLQFTVSSSQKMSNNIRYPIQVMHITNEGELKRDEIGRLEHGISLQS